MATSSYKLKKEKQDGKSDTSAAADTSWTLIDSTVVSVLGSVNEQKKHTSHKMTLAKDKDKAQKHSRPSKSSKLSTDNKLEALDQKWLEHFSRLESILLA